MLIHIQHDNPPEMTGCPVMLLVHLMEVHMRGLAVHIAKTRGINITCYILQVDAWSTQMVTSDTTPHVYGRVLLMVAFSCSKWITMIP
jgi:hypothetical protein